MAHIVLVGEMTQNMATMQMNWDGMWYMSNFPEAKSQFAYESKTPMAKFRPAQDSDKPQTHLPGSGAWHGSFQTTEGDQLVNKEEKNLQLRLTRGSGSNLNKLELHAEGRNYIGSFVVTGTVEIADGIGRAHCKKLYTRFAQVKRVRQPKRKYGEGYEAGSASAKAKSSVTASSRLQPAYADGPPTKKIKDEASIRKPEEEESPKEKSKLKKKEKLKKKKNKKNKDDKDAGKKKKDSKAKKFKKSKKQRSSDDSDDSDDDDEESSDEDEDSSNDEEESSEEESGESEEDSSSAESSSEEESSEEDSDESESSEEDDEEDDEDDEEDGDDEDGDDEDDEEDEKEDAVNNGAEKQKLDTRVDAAVVAQPQTVKRRVITHAPRPKANRPFEYYGQKYGPTPKQDPNVIDRWEAPVLSIEEFEEAARIDSRLRLGVTHMYYQGTQKVISVPLEALEAIEKYKNRGES